MAAILKNRLGRKANELAHLIGVYADARELGVIGDSVT
jgi:hypothetical protein